MEEVGMQMYIMAIMEADTAVVTSSSNRSITARIIPWMRGEIRVVRDMVTGVMEEFVTLL
jgi:hypothetical protein